MSDLRNADGSPIAPEAQGPEVLSPDDQRRSTHGGIFDQNTLSYCRGVEVEASSSNSDAKFSPNNEDGAASREPANVSGMSVSGVAVSVKQTAHRAIEGSNGPADFRKGGDTVKASLQSAADNGGPRAPMGQFPNGKNCK